MRGRRLVYAALATILLVFLMRTCPAPQPLYDIREPKPPTELEAAFDPARCGTVRGTIVWNGDAPVVPPIQLIQVSNPPGGQKTAPNPNAPQVTNHRFANAIVYLTEVDPARSRAWTLPRVTVEVRTTDLTIRQGLQSGRRGIVRRGQSVELLSKETLEVPLPFHSIRARGAAFFTQMLPVQDKPVTRLLSDFGIVELTSGSGYYWLRGYLLAIDVPYAIVTGPAGAFEFSQVPDGSYEMVCWIPNWHVKNVELDPEIKVEPVRLLFRAAAEKRIRIAVKAGESVEPSIAFSAADFDHAE